MIDRGIDVERVRWVFFDIGSTLVDETAAYDHRIREMIVGTYVTFGAFDNARITFARQGLDGNAAAIRYFGLRKTLWHSEDEEPFNDAEETLARLCRKGYRLGIIANQPPGTAERLAAWGLAPFFDVLVSSAEMGIAKPDLAIFEKALKLSACAAEESVMVGDRLDNDMAPAKTVGMKTVWLKQGLAAYQNAELGRDVADYQIGTLSELLTIL